MTIFSPVKNAASNVNSKINIDKLICPQHQNISLIIVKLKILAKPVFSS